MPQSRDALRGITLHTYLDSHSLTAPSSQVYIECTQAPAHCLYTDDSDPHKYPLGSWYMHQSLHHTLYFCCYRNTEHSVQMVHCHSPRACILKNQNRKQFLTQQHIRADPYPVAIYAFCGREDWKLGGIKARRVSWEGRNNSDWVRVWIRGVVIGMISRAKNYSAVLRSKETTKQMTN